MKQFIYRPLSNKVKIKVLGVEDEVSKGGIILTNDIQEKEVLEFGEVIELGKLAYLEYDEKPIKIGDTVVFQRYSGKSFREGSELIRILNDEDVFATRETIEV